MRLEKGVLDTIQDREKFVRHYCDFVSYSLRACRLYPVMSSTRLADAHGAWCNDIDRVGTQEKNLADGLDHFKQCGHLIFWLRRMSPFIEARDDTKNLGDAEGMPLSDDEKAFRKLLSGYANEYLAFDYGLQICKFYEIGKEPSSEFAKTLAPSREYYVATCQFLKYKNVSPHGLHLILKSLFSH